MKPDGMFIAKMFAVIVIVLEADLGEFAGIKSQVGRNARSLAAEDIFGVESAVVSIDPLAAKTSHPSRLESPQELRIETPIAEDFGWQTGSDIFASFKALIERLGLPRNKRKAGICMGGFPFPIQVRAVDLSVPIAAG